MHIPQPKAQRWPSVSFVPMVAILDTPSLRSWRMREEFTFAPEDSAIPAVLLAISKLNHGSSNVRGLLDIDVVSLGPSRS